MSTTPTQATPKLKGLPSFILTLADTGRADLQFKAAAHKDGTATSYALHRVKDEKGKIVSQTRGMTAQHASFDAAREACLKAAAVAQKDGWHKRAVGRGFVPKPDAFTLGTLPKAKK